MDPERYRELFFQESRELLAKLSQALLALERCPGDPSGLAEVYRIMHTLKGMAATVGYQRTSDLAHALESVLEAVRQGTLALAGDLMDLLFNSANEFERLTARADGGEPWNEHTESLLEEVAHFVVGARATAPVGRPAAAAPPAQAVAASPRHPPTLRISVKRLDSLINLAGELLIIKSRLRTLGATLDAPALAATLDQLDRVSANLQVEVLQARMFPIGSLFDRFTRTVRDLAHEAGKQVNLVITGHEIELDRAILDELSEPLIHLLRNAVAHGIESPPERARGQKPATGTITLSAAREADRVVLEVRDDGRGIDPEQVRAVAVKTNLVPAEQAPALSHQELMALLFLPGFTTASDVTGVAGRGVGLNVVKTRIEALKGSVAVRSLPGAGASFILRLPPTLAIVEALLVQVAEETFAVPLADVAQILEINRAAAGLRTMLLPVRDQTISLIDLACALRLANGTAPHGPGFVLVSALAERPTGFIVDHILGRQDIVIKPIERLMQQVAGFSGATILGDGRVVLILDLHALLRESASRPITERTAQWLQ